MGIFKIIILIFIFSSFVNAQVVINEIMYNPSGSDTNTFHEWIEIYNNGKESVNLSNWKFFEANTNHALVLGQGNMILLSKEYAVIVQNNKTFLNDSSWYKGKVIETSFSLSNTGEYFALKNSSLSVINGLNYSNSWNNNAEGKSIELINPSLNNNVSNNWNGSLNLNGTPGSKNSIFLKILFGDVSGNGFVSAYDASLILSYLNGKNLSKVQFLNADVNLDSKVDKDDSSIILKYLVGKVKELPTL